MSERPMGPEGDRAPLAALRGFVRQRVPLERCELCGKGLPPEHAHLVRPEQRQLVCACEPCAVLFTGTGASTYKRVPRRITILADYALTDHQWDALTIPIDLAFFLYSSPAGQIVAVYPSPAGPTESLLHLEAWDDIAAGHPRLRALEPDVEALLVNRVRQREDWSPRSPRVPESPSPLGHSARYLVVPIDECYRLVGLIRKSWRGLSGGAVVWGQIAEFFARLEARADSRTESARA